MENRDIRELGILFQFVDFMRFGHFETEDNLKVTFEDRTSKKVVTYNNLYEAFSKYKWNKNDYEKTKIKLDDVSCQLKVAFKDNNEKEFIEACKEILKWGNVKNNHTIEKLSDPKFFEFVKKLDSIWHPRENVNDILTLIKEQFQDQTQVFSNAGFTKIYSLLFDNWVIYDSRVAAGLQYLILLFMEKYEHQDIPSLLNIASPPSRGDKTGDYRTISLFNKTYSKSLIHLESNVIANYILKQYFNNNTKTLFKGNDRLRQLEAALFMIGYDLSDNVEKLNIKVNLKKKGSL